MKSWFLITTALANLCGLAWAATPGAITEYRGACDASALAVLDNEHFAMATDEDNVLRIYHRSRTNAPVWQADFSAFFDLENKSPEADIEAAARIGDVIYWITSHGRNADGKPRPNRQRLFATRIVKTPAGFELKAEGKPCKTLLNALLAEPRLTPFKLADAAQRAPELDGALNIEGLTATPTGGLLIAFRNPVLAGKALLVPLENPADVVTGQEPRFGDAVQLNLDGRGVRDITLVGKRYFLIAGGAADKGKFSLFEWTGPGSEPVERRVTFGKLKPEGIAGLSSNTIELLCTSDDSGRRIGDCDCKDLKDPAQRAFRLLTLNP